MSLKFKRAACLAVAFLFLMWGDAYAADVVGLVDSQRIIFQHPEFDEAARLLIFLSRPLEGDAQQLLTSERNPDRRDLITKFSEQVTTFAAMDRAIAAEEDQERRARLWENRQSRLSELEAGLMGPILEECRQAMQAVMTLKGMTVLIEQESAFYGGTDISEEVIQRLRR